MNDVYKTVAKVSHVPDEYTVVINRGQNDGLKGGERFLIFGLGDEIFDPDTNQSLGRLEIVRGRAIVSHIQQSMATLTAIDFEEVHGKRKIIRRDNPTNSLSLALALGLGQSREEIEEGPERIRKSLDASIGDFAKPI